MNLGLSLLRLKFLPATGVKSFNIGLALGLPVRHPSKQYFISFQFFFQLLRHVIARPQARQILRNSDDLLPLKPMALAQGVVVVVRVGAVVTAPQFHRHVFVGVGDAFHAQQGCSMRYF